MTIVRSHPLSFANTPYHHEAKTQAAFFKIAVRRNRTFT